MELVICLPAGRCLSMSFPEENREELSAKLTYQVNDSVPAIWRLEVTGKGA